MMKLSFARRVGAGIMVLVLSATGASIASAVPTAVEPISKERPEKIVEQDLTEEELAAAEAELEKLFTEYLYQDDLGNWVVNEKLAEAEGIDIAELQVIADRLNSRGTEEHGIGSEAYNRCVLNAVGMGGLAGAASKGGSHLGYLIAVKNWREVAWVLARLVGVNALRGGIAGATVALAAAGSWCATPWAG